ncbi:rhodanese-like domain-containing protein [Roseateles sp.]|uniref:rhodanese-like domain-containing protein n=1 Tax=Roseateles sp. TaxID=1971397 RepID=UPI0025F88E47|nr:rhodanese-like domain-containing protein [Roseateles sp.]
MSRGTGSARRRLGLQAVAALALMLGNGWTAAVTDPASLPEPKRTKAGMYLSASEVPGFIQSQGGASRVLFLDIRTRAEAMFVGMPTAVDALVPFVELQELMTDWDAQRNAYKLEPMQDFVPEVRRRLVQKGLQPTDAVVLICRSGDRSARAANRLAEDGFTRVWSVVDGFEGDLDKEGRRSVNGWRNAGLPWSYKLDRSRMYFPR